MFVVILMMRKTFILQCQLFAIGRALFRIWKSVRICFHAGFAGAQVRRRRLADVIKRKGPLLAQKLKSCHFQVMSALAPPIGAIAGLT
jgi:hypothetical protein